MHVFKLLFDLKRKRSIVEAIIFYIAYFILCVGVSSSLTIIIGIIISSDSPETATILSASFSIIFVIALSYFLLKKKGLLNWTNIVLIIVSVVLYMFGGLILGLIFPTYFSTLKSLNK